MSNILTPDAPDFRNPKSAAERTGGQIQGTPVYSDQSYLILRKGAPQLGAGAVKVPFQIVFIGIGGINAQQMIPLVGKDAFLAELKVFEKTVRKLLNRQKAIAEGIVEQKKASKR